MMYGEEGIVKSIKESLKGKIAGMGIRVGKKVKMQTKQPIKGSVVIIVDKAEISLGLGLADKILVEVRNENSVDGSS